MIITRQETDDIRSSNEDRQWQWPNFAEWALRNEIRPAEVLHFRRGSSRCLETRGTRHPRRFDDSEVDRLVLTLMVSGHVYGRADEPDNDTRGGRLLPMAEFGHVFASSPGMPSNLEAHGSTEFVTVSFSFTASTPLPAQPGLTRGLDLGPLGARAWEDPQVRTLCADLDRFADAEDSLSTQMQIDGLWMRLCARLLQLGQSAMLERNELQPGVLGNILDMARERLSVGVTSDDLAVAAGVDPSQFGRLFKQATGESPRVYLMRLRVEQAKTLLRHYPEWTTEEVAHSCGYRDVRDFVKCFDLLVGELPTIWRQTTTP
ncbi:MAG: helix-turn-helix domain-containing protein [Planctomycetota bacterium]